MESSSQELDGNADLFYRSGGQPVIIRAFNRRRLLFTCGIPTAAVWVFVRPGIQIAQKIVEAHAQQFVAGHIRKVGLPKQLQIILSHDNPTTMHCTRRLVRTHRVPQKAPVPALNTFQGLDDVEQGNSFGFAGELEPAAHAALRANQTIADEDLQQFAEITLGNINDFGNARGPG